MGKFEPGHPQYKPAPEANRPWSIHNALRRAAARQASDEDKRPNAEVIADMVVELAKKGDIRAAEFITERIDGKLVQPNLNADLSVIQGMTDEELRAYIESFNTLASPGGGEDGNATAGHGKGNDAEGGPEHAAPGNTGSV